MPSHSPLSSQKQQVALLSLIITDSLINNFSGVIYWSLRFGEMLRKLAVSQENLICQ